MKIEFGVMSSRYEMECENIEDAKMAMCLFIGQNIPIAIYKPEETAISPLTYFQSNPQVNKEIVQKAFKSIKKIL